MPLFLDSRAYITRMMSFPSVYPENHKNEVAFERFHRFAMKSQKANDDFQCFEVRMNDNNKFLVMR